MQNKKILWFDIETVAETSSYGNYPKKSMRSEKCRDNKFPGLTEEESYYKHSGFYPEFGKVICIATQSYDGVVKSFGHRGSEKRTIEEFFEYLDQLGDERILGGYNIIGFDIPFLWKRCVINGMKPHKKICVGNIKPWERQEIDVMQIRKQGSFTCSLDLLSMCLFKSSPKSGEVNSSSVFDVFYGPRPAGEGFIEDSRLKKIIKYCEADVDYTKQCYEKIQEFFVEVKIEEKKETSPTSSSDDIEHLLPQGAVEVKSLKGDASDKQRNFIKRLWKNIDKYVMVPGFSEKLDEYLQEVYGKNLDELDKSQASGLIARLNDINSSDSPHVANIRSILLPNQDTRTDLNDLPF